MTQAVIELPNKTRLKLQGGKWKGPGVDLINQAVLAKSYRSDYDPDPIGTAIKVALMVAGGGKVISRNQPDYVEGRVY